MGFEELEVDDARSDFEGAGVWRFHRDGRSTRSTRVHVQPAGTDVTINAMASPEDVALAVALAERAAVLIGAREIAAEGFGVVAPGELATWYDAAWIDGHLRSGARALRAMIEQGRGPMQIPGPNRSVYLGTRVLAELDAGPAADLHLRMLEWIRAVRWASPRTAAVFLDGTDRRIGIWLGDEVVFPACDVAVIGEGDDAVVVPSERVPELAGAAWRWLDERQGVIADVSERWPAIVAAARAFAA